MAHRSASSFRAAVLAAALAALAACGPTKGSRVQTQVSAFRSEQTPDKLFERGKAFAQVGDLTRAEQYLAAAVEAGADETKVIPLLLRVCAEDYRYRVAIEYAEHYLAKHPSDTATRFVLGSMYHAVSDDERARAELGQVVMEKPTHAEAYFALATIEHDAGDVALADRHYRDYLRVDPAGHHAEAARALLLKSVP